MKLKLIITIFTINSLLFLASCKDLSRRDKVMIGIGTAVIAGGALLYYMNQRDKNKVQNVLENSPTGQSVTWRNPETNIPFQMAVNNTFQQGNRACRQYTLVGKRRDRKTTTACRQSNGFWN